MNLNAMKALCHGGRHAQIYNTLNGGQWISNGFGAWLVDGVVIEDADALKLLWNLSNKARAKAVITVADVEDERFTFNALPDEEELKELGAIAWSDETTYIGLGSEAGTLYVDAALLKPVRGDYRQYYARWKDGNPMVAVYDDLTTCVALVLPAGNQVADILREEAAKLTAPVFHWPDEKKQAEAAAADAEAAAEAMLKRDEGDGDDP